jgi:hypothetical protein
MNTESIRATLADVLVEERESDTATFELLLQSMDEGWVEILIQDAHTDKVHTYMLSRKLME